jgi:hypothetical protein
MRPIEISRINTPLEFRQWLAYTDNTPEERCSKLAIYLDEEVEVNIMKASLDTIHELHSRHLHK